MKKNKKPRYGLTDALDIPPEALFDLPIITVRANEEICVENFNGIIEYTEHRIRLQTKCGIVLIEGTKLEAKSMTAELITIRGRIENISFIS